MSLQHVTPFSTIMLSQLCRIIDGVRTEMRIRGSGVIFPVEEKPVEKRFLLLETKLCQHPEDLHAVRIPDGMYIGQSLVIYRDYIPGDYFVQMNFAAGTIMMIYLENKDMFVCRSSVLYRMVGSAFRLEKVDGKDSY